MSEIKLFLDEDMPVSLASQLRRRGIDAVTVEERDMKGSNDDKVMNTAIEENRAIVTLDRDFISKLDEKYGHRGIILFKKTFSIGKMIQEIQKVLDNLEAEEITNVKIYLPWKE